MRCPSYDGLALERELQNRLFAMADAKEGFRAFLEKRKPMFHGRLLRSTASLNSVEPERLSPAELEEQRFDVALGVLRERHEGRTQR